jgi:hypothetical protein
MACCSADREMLAKMSSDLIAKNLTRDFSVSMPISTISPSYTAMVNSYYQGNTNGLYAQPLISQGQISATLGNLGSCLCGCSGQGSLQNVVGLLQQGIYGGVVPISVASYGY